MAAPTKFVQSYDFSDFQTSNPADPLPGDQVDIQLALLKTTTDETIDALANVRRSDGALVNGIVTPDSFSTAALALMGDFTLRGAWVTATAYAVDDLVSKSNVPYVCLVAHTSGVFATDLAAAKWMALGPNAITVDGTSLVTADIPFGGHKLTGVAAGVSGTDATNVTQATALAAAAAAAVATAAASETVSGKAELATQAESDTGTDDLRIVTPLKARVSNKDAIIIAVTGETAAVTTGTSKRTFRMPYAFTLTAVRASLHTAQTSGSIMTVDINEAGSTILSTKLTIDNTEKTSTTAVTAPVLSDTALADDAEISIDVDQVGDGTGAGLKVTLIGYRA